MTSLIRPLTPMRKVIAARMVEAKQSIPHFRLIADIEVDTLLTLRAQLNGKSPEKVSLNDFIIKACAISLLKHPAVNVQWAENAVNEAATADISVVIALEQGLTTPIVRSAETKSIVEISREVKSLADRARKGQLKMDQIIGGTFSVSNLGMYGVDQFDAIINPPQCAILAVGRARRRVVVAPGDVQNIAALMRVTLSVDHRVIDGAVAARFIETLRQNLEQPKGLLAQEG